jgi:hypothetical protein
VLYVGIIAQQREDPLHFIAGMYDQQFRAFARELLDVTILLPDGATLVAAPWESAAVAGGAFGARNKGGNIEAYSASLTLVPELRLAYAFAYNGGADEAAAAADASAALVPALAAALAAAAPPPNQGPAPAQFEGVYACATPGAAPDAYVLERDGYLLFVVPGLLSAPLDWAGPAIDDAFRVYVPPGTLTCLASFELAIAGAYVVFGRNGNGTVTSVAIPGWAPGLAWSRE